MPSLIFVHLEVSKKFRQTDRIALHVFDQPASPSRAASQLLPVSNIGSAGFNQLIFKRSNKLVLIVTSPLCS